MPHHSEWAGSPQRLSPRVNRLLVQIPVLLSCAVGLAFGLSRFIGLLREELIASPDSWKPIFLLVFITGSVALLIAMAMAALGLLVGLALKAAFCGWQSARLSISGGTHGRSGTI